MDLVTVFFTLVLLDLELLSDLLLLYEVRLVRVLWGEVEEEFSTLGKCWNKTLRTTDEYKQIGDSTS